MQTGRESVERQASEEDLASVHAALALAHELAADLEDRAMPAYVALMGVCWLLADLLLTAEVMRGIPTSFGRELVDRQITNAIGELRATLLADPGKIQ